MSVTQAIASSRFINAMGPLLEDEDKFLQVLEYIYNLRGDSMPCQFTEEEIIALADKAEQEERDGVGMMSHQQFVEEIATWRV